MRDGGDWMACASLFARLKLAAVPAHTSRVSGDSSENLFQAIREGLGENSSSVNDALMQTCHWSTDSSGWSLAALAESMSRMAPKVWVRLMGILKEMGAVLRMFTKTHRSSGWN